MKYIPIIGLEVHIELKTNSKMFCSCSADYFGKQPNTHTCPICLGLPGALPAPNKQAVEWCVTLALALNCSINNLSKFDRKNYFYPDLPKGFQISQYDLPFGEKGYVDLHNGKRIRIRRVHMEEDTGKLIHEEIQGKKVSLIDFNRSGVPLVEIVTEPDFHSAEDVIEYMRKLQMIVRYLNVSNADMEKGDMRLEPNISLAIDENQLPTYKVEVKNINSFKFVERAIKFELQRQQELLENDKTPLQETRGWNEAKNATVSQRVKEEANDYRYFPEPDIPPIIISHAKQSELQAQLPEFQDEKIKRFVRDYQLTTYDAEILTREKVQADYFEEAVKIGKEVDISPKQIANTIINRKIDIITILPARLIKDILETTKNVEVNDVELDGIISKVLYDNPKAVKDYKNGKESVIMFFIGQIMSQLPKGTNSNKIKEKLLEKI